MKTILVAIFLVVTLAACGSEAEPTATPIPVTATLAPTSTPNLTVDDRLSLEAQLGELVAVSEQIDEVWQNLAEGKTAQCGAEFHVIPPDAFEPNVPIERELRFASTNLYEAVQLWKAECDLARQTVPSDLIQEALNKVRIAKEALADAEEALSQ